MKLLIVLILVGLCGCARPISYEEVEALSAQCKKRGLSTFIRVNPLREFNVTGVVCFGANGETFNPESMK